MFKWFRKKDKDAEMIINQQFVRLNTAVKTYTEEVESIRKELNDVYNKLNEVQNQLEEFAENISFED